MTYPNQPSNPNPLPWHVVEKRIQDEIRWLDLNILETKISYKDGEHPIACRKCILREIALLIIFDNISAREINSPNLWISIKKDRDSLLMKQHGKDWHFNMMRTLAAFFQSEGYIVEQECKMNYGTSDLYVFKKNERPIYVEVGTVSLYKLLYNLSTMIGSDILIIPRDNYAIEFSIIKSSYPLSRYHNPICTCI